MAEWSNAAVLKTVVCNRTGGSNPSFSAKSPKHMFRAFSLFKIHHLILKFVLLKSVFNLKTMKFKLSIIFLTFSMFICLHSKAQNTLDANKEQTKEIAKIAKNKSVQLALKIIDNTDEQTIKDMVVLTEIPAPPFKETKRAEKFVEMLKNEGVDKVWIDKEGNVIALRKGTVGNRNIVLDAHMDTVFPEDTNVTVKVEGNTYIAPGVGDNTRGMAMVLAILRAMNKAKIQTKKKVPPVPNSVDVIRDIEFWNLVLERAIKQLC